MAINRLSDCKTVDDFNLFSKNLNINANSTSRYFIYTSGVKARSYTMNQIVYQWNLCLKQSIKTLKDEDDTALWKELRTKIAEGMEKIEALDKAPRKKSIIRRIRRSVGNFFFALTHSGPNKSQILANIKKNHVDILYTLVDESVKRAPQLLALAQKVTRSNEAADTFFREAIENIFLMKHCSFSDILENSEVLERVLNDPLLIKAFVLYAKYENIQDFLDFHLKHLCEIILQKKELTLENSFTSEVLANYLEEFFRLNGRDISEVMHHPDLSELLMQDDTIKKALDISYEKVAREVASKD